MKTKIITLIYFVSLFCAGALLAGHLIGMDSVDSGEIRWGSSTTYTDARNWANTEWDSLGGVDIEPDTIWTYEDLRWKDVDDSALVWDGAWTPKTGTDTIELNKHYLSGYSTFSRRTVAAHELGHALGIDDHTTADHSSSQILMFHCSTCSGKNTPQAHDEDDYNSLW